MLIIVYYLLFICLSFPQFCFMQLNKCYHLSPFTAFPTFMQMVVKTFMDMDQDSEEEKELYLNLALHLASDFFLKHPDKDVRLLVACCLADIFRIYAPEAPYTSPDKLKVHPLKLHQTMSRKLFKLHNYMVCIVIQLQLLDCGLNLEQHLVGDVPQHLLIWHLKTSCQTGTNKNSSKSLSLGSSFWFVLRLDDFSCLL